MSLDFQLQLYRGNLAELDAVASVDGVPGFVEDVRALIVGDGTTNWADLPDDVGYVRGSVELISGSPSVSATLEDGLFRYDTTNDILYVSDGSSWLAVTGAEALDDLSDVTITTPASGEVLRYDGSGWVNAVLALGDCSGDLDDIADGTNYARVKAGYVTGAGEVAYLRNVTAGVDATVNDTGTANDDLWTANKINAELTAISSSYSRREKVIDVIADNTVAPPTETTGDRYILSFDGGSPHADWDGASAGDIVEFNGSTWDATTPTEGWIAYSDDDDKDALMVDDGTPAWELRNVAVTNHNDLSGLQGGTTSEYYHLTSSDYNTLRGGSSDASSLHHHDSDYYTETELDAGQLDNRYYTESEIDTLLDGKQDDVITTQGDIVVGNASAEESRLGIGASGTVLKSDGTDPAWSNVIDMGTF